MWNVSSLIYSPLFCSFSLTFTLFLKFISLYFILLLILNIFFNLILNKIFVIYRNTIKFSFLAGLFLVQPSSTQQLFLAIHSWIPPDWFEGPYGVPGLNWGQLHERQVPLHCTISLSPISVFYHIALSFQPGNMILLWYLHNFLYLIIKLIFVTLEREKD